MSSGTRIFLAITALLIICIAVPATAITAASIGTTWKERISGEGAAYSGVMFSSNGSRVFAGGSQMYVRSWDGKLHWGGHPGSIATMNADGNYVVYGLGKTVVMLDKDGVENWSRTMEGPVRAVAISANGTFIVAADERGNINSWYNDGYNFARNQTSLVKQLAISPQGTLVVATTDTGLKYLTPALDPVWSDTKNGSIDTDILFSSDGSTIITSGGKRVSSHTNTGNLNWMYDITQDAIISTACSYDCSVIVIGSQDKNVQAMDRYGKVHWTYPGGEWINAVGVSQDAHVIVAAGIDRNLYVLDHGGKLLTQKKMDSIIHPRALAVSADGTRIAIADEYALYGLTLAVDSDEIELVTLIPRSSAQYSNTPTPVPTTETPVITAPVTSLPVTPVPVTTTPKSPLDPVTAVLAFGAGLSLVCKRRKP